MFIPKELLLGFHQYKYGQTKREKKGGRQRYITREKKKRENKEEQILDLETSVP